MSTHTAQAHIKCKYAKISLTTKMIQQSKSMQNDAYKRNFKQKK